MAQIAAFRVRVDPNDRRTLGQLNEILEKSRQIDRSSREMAQEVQEDHGPHTRLVAFYDDTLKTLEFKAGLSQGLTTGAGPYRGKQI